MKKQILAIAFVGAIGVTSLLAQGTLKFTNFEGAASNPTYKALVFDVDAANPTVGVTGNPGNGVPVGTAVYGNTTAIQGTGFTAALWVGTTAANLQQVSTSTFRTGAAAGVFTAKTVTLPTQAGFAPGDIVFMQIRAWNNANGVDTWDKVLANNSVARGLSAIVQSAAVGGADPVTGNIFLTPNTTVQSFSLFVPVPEPSIVGLGILGGLGLFLIRRRK